MKTVFLRAPIIQVELRHYWSLHKNAEEITLIINHTYINTALQSDAAKYAACTLWHFFVATVYKIKHFMLARRQFA